MSLERKASELRIVPGKARMTKEAVINYYESMLMNKFYDKLSVGYIKKPTAPSLHIHEELTKKEGVFTEPKIKSTHDVLVLTNGKLPNLRLRQNQSFQ